MKFLLDANVEYRLAAFLTTLGHDVKTIALDYPTSLIDQAVLTLAVEEQRILLTNDCDFGELIFRQHVPPLRYYLLPAQELQRYFSKAQLVTNSSGNPPQQHP